MALGNGVKILPDEMLSLICQELGSDRDFSTLYRCALSAKSLADPALRTLYQYHEQSPSFIQSDEELRNRTTATFGVVAQQFESRFKKWTLLWRSIILSSFENQTYKPYCRYLRVLDFRNLSSMLEDSKFVGNTRKSFFAGELKPFLFQKAEYTRTVVDIVPAINAIGEALSDKASMVEDISGNLSPGFLARWIGRAPRLQSLVLWRGEALENGAGDAIKSKCDYFKFLTIHDYLGPQADQAFADFLDSMNNDTLGYFEMISFSNLNKLSFKALGSHGGSLKELKLGSLSREAMENLNCLKDCRMIETLLIEDNTRATQLEALNNDVFVDVIDWLSSCFNLRDISLKNFFDGPAILARVLSSPNVELTRLSLEGYTVHRHESAAFHTALTEQKGLESVWLKGNGEDTIPDDLSIMVEALCNLSNLRELVLKDVSDEFDETHIAGLAISLPLLEDFWTSGGEIGPDILPTLANLKQLKNLTLYAMTKFDSHEIIEFISMLDEQSQKGFNLSLMASDPEYDLTEEEQDLIREIVRTKLEGRFDFVLWREADPSDSEDD